MGAHWRLPMPMGIRKSGKVLQVQAQASRVTDFLQVLRMPIRLALANTHAIFVKKKLITTGLIASFPVIIFIFVKKKLK